MLNNVFLSFDNNSFVETQELLFGNVINNFTIEFWAKPLASIVIETQKKKEVSRVEGQNFIIFPMFGSVANEDSSRAGVGVSVGTNGVAVFEHSQNYLPATLVAKVDIKNWTHIAIVYRDKTPFLFLDGKKIMKGETSIRNTVVPSGVFGGTPPFGSYIGFVKEIRIWNTARTKGEIIQNMNNDLSGNEQGLFGYWKMNEGNGNIVHDSTKNQNHGIINGAIWNESQERTNDRKNILFTYYIPSGGVETLNRQRFFALSSHGVNCHFLYSKEGVGLQNKMETATFITNDDDEIKDIINNGNYDAIVVCSDLNLLKKICNFGYKGKLIYEIQGLGINIKFANHFLKNNADIINDYCDALLFPETPHLFKSLQKNFPFKKRYCFHNCFNTAEFKYHLYPKEDNPIIGWVGRLEQNKNWRDFLTIGAQLIQNNSSIKLWMFEDSTLAEKNERDAFEKMVDDLNIRQNLTIYANQPHRKMAEFFSIIGDSGGLLCSTSKVEGFGYAVLEAMVCRCPVLSTDSDGVRSFIEHNLTGKFFEIGNIPQGVEEATELMENIKLRETIRQNGFRHIEVNFSPEKYAENFLNMISDIGEKN
ncbi:glycosyltransferase involved in cell wall biosynthesis [Metabacillus crassostreae]|uniref:glycosyltransferase n=1 Tax=Metabacillus crassostreae TaxID=929098 RepID=UPI00195CA998|nr:glycosyltransferase [Metabacillus crassostreae]MBM7603171.1 glycosyltransferase involved in cell wall biosynthesis [Metabacillus crassostreae]